MSAAHRAGFRELMARVCLGEVGAVLGLEVSRLARSNANLARLAEMPGRAARVTRPAASYSAMTASCYGASQYEELLRLNRLWSRTYSVRYSWAASWAVCSSRPTYTYWALVS
jgi:hypothetical protein